MGLYSSKMNATLQAQIASVALAVEVFERKMITAGVLKENELMEEISKLAQQKMLRPKVNV
jgi:hypothetical protein